MGGELNIQYILIKIKFCSLYMIDNERTEVEFVHAVTAGGSVKFLPAV